MKDSKAERLKRAGWKVGSTREFLELSDEEAALVEMKVALARNLRLRRQRRRLTQTQLAKIIESSQSRVAKMEAADASVSLDLLVRALLILGASRRDVARIIAPDRKKAA